MKNFNPGVGAGAWGVGGGGLSVNNKNMIIIEGVNADSNSYKYTVNSRYIDSVCSQKRCH